MVASSLRGEIAAYFLSDARGRVVTLRQLCTAMGVRFSDQEARARVRNAVRALYREGQEEGAPLVLEVVIRAQAWKQANYVATAADIEQAAGGPPPFDPKDFVDAPRPENEDDEEPDPEPTDRHVCAFEVVGRTTGDNPKIILRNSIGEIFKAVPIGD